MTGTRRTIPFASDGDVTNLAKSGRDVRTKFHATPLSESLRVASPLGNNAAGLRPFSTPDGTKFEVPLTKLRPYDRNPRKAANAAFDEIKASLSATGPASLELWVTQRPGSEHYMPYRGGNTRLSAVLALAQEGDTRWDRLIVTYKQWVSEADTLAQHLIENNNRADMSFWDKACAYLIDMRAEVEQETGGELSLRRLEEELARRGIGVKKSRLSLFQFAVQRLSVLGPYLSAKQVIQLQPAINHMARLAEKFGVGEAEFQTLLNGGCKTLLSGVQEADADESRAAEGSATDLVAALEASLAAKLGTSTTEIRRWLDTLQRFPDMSPEDLRKPVAEKSVPAHHKPPPPPPPESPPTKPEAGESLTQHPVSGRAPVEGGSAEEPGKNSGGVPAHSVRQAQTTVTRLQAVVAFAKAAYVSDCLRENTALPRGFYMETPEAAIDLAKDCPSPAVRIVAWQLLSVLSGQWQDEVARRLPADSLWRRMLLTEGGLDADALPLYVQDQLLVELGKASLDETKGLGWGVLLPVGWVVSLMTDPACIAPLYDVLQLFSQGEIE